MYKFIFRISGFLVILFFNCKEASIEPKLLGDKDNGGLILPEGFKALVVADSTGLTRHLAVNNNGDIYIKLRYTKGQDGNLALRDTNHDGKADIFKRFGNYPNDGSFATEMRIFKGYLYFSSEQVVYRQKLTPNELIPQSDIETLVIDTYPLQWHNAKSLAFDNKGYMYVTFSAPTNACEDYKTTGYKTTANVLGELPCSQLNGHAGIWRFRLDKHNQYLADGELFATGLRSVVAMSWNNEDNQLYAVTHGRDYLYQHDPDHYTPWQNAVLPAEEFIKINLGDNFGWPYTYYDPFKRCRIIAPEYGGMGQKVSTNYTEPIMSLPAHWAPNDLLFYKGNMFPEKYKNGAFVAFHGSTNCAPYPQVGYFVAFIPFINGQPNGEWEVFADGFAGVDTIVKMEDAMYRPMGLAEGPDGSLYISESKKGKIWRIFYSDNKSLFKESQLIKMQDLKKKSYLKTPDEKLDNLSLRQVIDGKSLYTTYCSPCHQPSGRGIDKFYPALIQSKLINNPTHLIELLLLGKKTDNLEIDNQKYLGNMPSFNFLSTKEMTHLINYLQKEFGNKKNLTENEISNIKLGLVN